MSIVRSIYLYSTFPVKKPQCIICTRLFIVADPVNKCSTSGNMDYIYMKYDSFNAKLLLLTPTFNVIYWCHYQPIG